MFEVGVLLLLYQLSYMPVKDMAGLEPATHSSDNRYSATRFSKLAFEKQIGHLQIANER